jgi:folate-binding protein YgfZ
VALHHLGTRGVVRVSGEGAHKLLNDTLTCRFDETLAGAGRWFALLSAQGKVQVEGLVTFAEDAWWFDIEAGATADFVRRMKLYRLRAKVEIEHLVGHGVLWTGDAEAPRGWPIGYRDERVPGLGRRFIVDERALSQLPVASDDPLAAFLAARVAVGVPEMGPDFAANDVFAHDIGLDLLNGIDFVKGCYIGQEVVSRMKHRGTARRRPVIVSGLEAGHAAVVADGREAGTVGPSLHGRAVGIVRLDRIGADGEATVNGVPVRLAIPTWGTYRFGESETAE